MSIEAHATNVKDSVKILEFLNSDNTSYISEKVNGYIESLKGLKVLSVNTVRKDDRHFIVLIHHLDRK